MSKAYSPLAVTAAASTTSLSNPAFAQPYGNAAAAESLDALNLDEVDLRAPELELDEVDLRTPELSLDEVDLRTPELNLAEVDLRDPEQREPSDRCAAPSDRSCDAAFEASSSDFTQSLPQSFAPVPEAGELCSPETAQCELGGVEEALAPAATAPVAGSTASVPAGLDRVLDTLAPTGPMLGDVVKGVSTARDVLNPFGVRDTGLLDALGGGKGGAPLLDNPAMNWLNLIGGGLRIANGATEDDDLRRCQEMTGGASWLASGIDKVTGGAASNWLGPLSGAARGISGSCAAIHNYEKLQGTNDLDTEIKATLGLLDGTVNAISGTIGSVAPPVGSAIQGGWNGGKLFANVGEGAAKDIGIYGRGADGEVRGGSDALADAMMTANLTVRDAVGDASIGGYVLEDEVVDVLGDVAGGITGLVGTPVVASTNALSIGAGTVNGLWELGKKGVDTMATELDPTSVLLDAARRAASEP